MTELKLSGHIVTGTEGIIARIVAAAGAVPTLLLKTSRSPFVALITAPVVFGCVPAVQYQYTSAASESDYPGAAECEAWQAVPKDPQRYSISLQKSASEALGRCGLASSTGGHWPPDVSAQPSGIGGHWEPGAVEPTGVSAQSNASQDEIPIRRQGNTYLVPVRINQTITLPFVLDTGAEELVLPVDVALTLMRAGALRRADFIGKSRYVMANGSEETQNRVVIGEVQVGDHTARRVNASVSSVRSNPLLGESFLSNFGTVTIDYNRLLLILSR